MKKIVFVINNFNTGGVQRSLLNLIKELHGMYEITVVSFSSPQIGLLPSDVRVIALHSPFKYFGMSQDEMKSTPVQYVIRSFYAIVTKLFGRSFAIKLMLPFQKKIVENDCEISFLHEAPQKSIYSGCNEFVLKKVKAKKKITWLHCDFELCGANNKSSKKIYSKFDEIIACSEGTRKSFIRCMPQFSNKCISLRNCNDYERIRRCALDCVMYDREKFNIVTVARLSKEKGIERALFSIKKCVDAGYDVHYHIVGCGHEADYLKSLTKEYELDDRVTFYGNQSNPYRFIKNADLFLLPSYHEAAPMVFDESAFLGVPVLATKTTSTDEMIIQSGYGFVCENSQDGITNVLMEILNNPKQLEEVTNKLKNGIFANDERIRRFTEIINGLCVE